MQRKTNKKMKRKYAPPQVTDVREKILNVYAATTTAARVGRTIFSALWAVT